MIYRDDEDYFDDAPISPWLVGVLSACWVVIILVMIGAASSVAAQDIAPEVAPADASDAQIEQTERWLRDAYEARRKSAQDAGDDNRRQAWLLRRRMIDAAISARELQNDIEAEPVVDAEPPTHNELLVIRGRTFSGAEDDYGLRLNRGDVLIEDCVFTGNGAGLLIQSGDGRGEDNRLRNVTIRRCRFVGNVGADPSHGANLAQIDGLTIEDCYFDLNGWDGESGGGAGGERSGFRHNLYLRRCRNVVVRGNVFRRASYNDFKLRTEEAGFDHVLIEGNVFVECRLGLDFSSNDEDGGTWYSDVVVRGNVFVRSQPFPKADSSTTAMQIGNVDGALIEDNLFIDSAADRGEAIRVRGSDPLDAVMVRNNTTDFAVPDGQHVFTSHSARRRRAVEGLTWQNNQRVPTRPQRWADFVSEGGDVEDAAAIINYYSGGHDE